MPEHLMHQYREKHSKYYEATRPEMRAFVPLGCQRLLDIGCGQGGFCAELQDQRKIECWGVELNPQAAAIAKRRLHTVYSSAFDETLDIPRGYFDAITFNDVLEHLPDPVSTLRFARTLLTPQGVIIASIPNFRHFPNMWKLCVEKSAEYQSAGIMDKTHLRIFTKSSIPKMFAEAELKVVHLAGINGNCAGRKYYPYFLLNALTLGWLEDMRWLNFAVVARP